MSALVAGAAAVPLLVLFYMLKLRRRPMRVPSTMLWEQAAADLQANVPLKWLTPSWLLVLHLLILGLFLGALARPALDVEAARARRVLLLVDRSASMSAMDGERGTRLAEAKARALVIAKSMRRTSRASVGVIAFGAEARTMAGLSEDDGEIERAIEGIEPSDQPGNLQAALDLAQGLLEAEEAGEGERERALVVIISDGGFARGQTPSIAGAEVRLERVGPKPGAVGNVGIAALAARRDYEDPAVVRVFARLVNASDSERGVNLRLTIREAGSTGQAEVEQRRALVIPAAVFEEERGELRVGSRAETFEVEWPGGGVLTLAIEGEDVLAADNAASIVLEEASPATIAVVRPGGANAPPTRASWILDDILAEIAQGPVRVMSPVEYEEAPPEVELVIFDGVEAARVPRGASLSFGAGVPGLELGEVVETPTEVLAWERSHPVLRHVALDTIRVAQGRRFVDVEGARVLARGKSGPLMAVTERGGVRRLVVGFELRQSNWPLHFSFPIFVASAVEYLTLRGDASPGGSVTTAEAALVRGQGRVRVTGPGGVVFDGDAPETGEVGLGVLERAGVYEVSGGSALAVNLVDEVESACATADAIEVAGTEVRANGTGLGGRTEIWHWFVMAAGVLLVVEWIVYAARMRV